MATCLMYAGATLALGLLGGPGCVDVEGDFNEFLERTADVRGAGPVIDGGAIDATLPDGGFQGTYFVACLPRLAVGNVQKALRFRGTVRFVPGPGGGTIDMTIEPIRTTATSLSDTVGAPLVKNGTPVSQQAQFTVDFGQPTIANEANPISTNAIVFQSCFIRGTLTNPPAHFCAELDGVISQPQEIDLNDPGDFCIFDEVSTPNAPTPQLDRSMFHCP